MTLSSTVYFGIWGTAVLAWLTLGHNYRNKREKELTELGDVIRSVNARSGYDQSVGRETLAKQFYHPRKSDKLREFAENNDVSEGEYITELVNEIGRPRRLIWEIRIYLAGLLIAFSGITFGLERGILPAEIYLVVVYALLLVSFGLYWKW
ncbi:hypothetical protein GCM10028857_01320 [Salinarchaeum chitinilyticum]